MAADDSKKPYGNVAYADPGYKNGVKRYPIDTEAHCRAAWSYINMPKNQAGYTAEQVSAIKGRIKAAAKRFGIEISDNSADPEVCTMFMDEERPSSAIEYRNATVGAVDFAQRLVTAIATPYEEMAKVIYRGEVWHEVFSRGAYDGIEKRPNRVRVNREHDRSRTVGKAMHFWPQREEGLVTELRVAQTPLGDETLALAAEDMLSLSVGFAPMVDGQQLDVRSKTRRITKAYLDHIAFVESPAYVGAGVLSVREGDELAASESALLTPNMDEFARDEILQWASKRLNRQ